MFRRLIYLLPMLLFAGAVNAQVSNNGQFRLTPTEIKALKAAAAANVPGSSNYSAVKEIVIMGNPAKPGIYMILLEVAPNTKIAAHLHPDQRAATVLSGTWHFGYGNKFDQTKLKTLPAGSIYSEVAGQNHFAMTGKEPVIVEITGYGPSGVTYVDPKNDPSHK
ncbi:cupin domain-containing protein [Mucilaginibacter jinjuensis]|uniref:Cupin domain-containing protein n=1 Tax=Mucilaginibacter jinjuensis TaxID=1176721 RepID=A0ABY7T3X4_9SPHI|nr:cupin domain-containing protein [Mucilaginibacter jinjuensis]WCT11036.1 cupin domain-containing protein [Mucilaginibacter jinjuensis]